jgi:CCR4-NOT transcription complex subunit 1
MLADLLQDKTDFFALDAACYAARHEYIDLERWLENAITSDGSGFVRAALDFVGHKVRHDLNRQDQAVQQGSEPSTLSVTAPIIATFLRALRSQ